MKLKKLTSMLLSAAMVVTCINIGFAEEAVIADTEDNTVVENTEETEQIGTEQSEIIEIPEVRTNAEQEEVMYIDDNENTESIEDAVISDEEYEDLNATTYTENGFEFYITNNKAYIDSYVGTEKDVVIPEYLGGCPVISVYGFEKNTNMESVYIPGCVEKICAYAFQDCSNLREVTLNEGLITLDSGAFKRCISLKAITIPSTVTTIGSGYNPVYNTHSDGVFQDCTSLSDVTINNSFIQVIMFEGCTSIKNLTLPQNVTEVEAKAFKDCTGLQTLNISGSGKIGSNAFNGCIALQSVDISKSNINEIGANTFNNCKSLRTVSLNDSLLSLDDSAFLNCISLQDITIPASVNEVGDNCFYGCTGLTKATVNNSTIGNRMFYNCNNLLSVDVTENLKTISSEAFSGCSNLMSIPLEKSSVTNIGSSAFYNSGLINISMPSSLIKIDNAAFKNCKNMKTFSLNEGLISLGDSAFYNCTALQSINIPSTIINIGSSVFSECKGLTSVNLKNSSVGLNMFYNCTSLSKVTIPETVNIIDNRAFYGCSALKLAQFEGNAPLTFGSSVFGNCNKEFEINYLNGKTGFTTPEWNGYPCYPVNSFEEKPVPSVKVAPPSFVVKGIFGGRNVTFNCATKEATIYYTTANRSNLNLNDPHVKPGETVTFNAYYGTVYARAYYNGQWSNPARLILRIPKVNDPTITKLSNGKVKIKTTTPSCIVYYTTDGSVPSASNYAGKFWTSHDVKIPAGKTVKAIAVRSCFSDSNVTTTKV